MQSEPAEIRPLSCEQTGDRFDEEGKGRSTSQTTRVPQRQDPFHPTIALLSACPLAPFAPQHAAAVGPLRDVIVASTPRTSRSTHRDSPSRTKCRAHVPALSSRAVCCLRRGGNAHTRPATAPPLAAPCPYDTAAATRRARGGQSAQSQHQGVLSVSWRCGADGPGSSAGVPARIDRFADGWDYRVCRLACGARQQASVVGALSWAHLWTAVGWSWTSSGACALRGV
jgi:hypothetical protein